MKPHIFPFCINRSLPVCLGALKHKIGFSHLPQDIPGNALNLQYDLLKYKSDHISFLTKILQYLLITIKIKPKSLP